VLPLLYLHGLSTGDFVPALEQFCGSSVGLSAATITRLTSQWQAEATTFGNRSLAGVDYVYVWVDGIHLKVRLDQDKICLLVMIGVRADGHKELIALSDGFGESSESWADLLRDCKRRGMRAPVLAVAGQLFGATILARGLATCSSCSVNTFTGQAGSTHSQVRFRHRSSTGRAKDGASTSRTVRRP